MKIRSYNSTHLTIQPNTHEAQLSKLNNILAKTREKNLFLQAT